jgi:hypothetical protein
VDSINNNCNFDNNNNNNNLDNNNNNNINNLDDYNNENFDLSNMVYPSQQEINGNGGERLSLSFVKDECPEMSAMIDQEIPQELHIHPIVKSPLNEDICIICNKKKTCIKGHKCNSCPLRICDECVNSIIKSFYSIDRHMHPLVLKEKENYTCDVCKKTKNFKNKFCFYCEKCNFGICLDCYIPESKKIDDEEKNIHEHPLINGSNFQNLVCKKCGEEIKEGYKCNDCEFGLCNNCYNYIINHKRKNDLHLHKMFLSVRDNWCCNECKNKNQGKISFFCKECNLDYCLNCFLE